MDMIKRILAGFLVVVGVVVALNLILTPLYHDGSPEYPLWRIVNWFMAVGVLVALVASFLRRRALGSEASPLDYLRITVTYYGAIVPHHVVLLGVVLDVESRQRDRGCRNLALDLLPNYGFTVRGRRPRHRRSSLERK